MDKVIIMTKADLFKPEVFVDVFSTIKVAENWARKNISQYIKKDGDSYTYTDSKTGTTKLLFLREMEVKAK